MPRAICTAFTPAPAPPPPSWWDRFGTMMTVAIVVVFTAAAIVVLAVLRRGGPAADKLTALTPGTITLWAAVAAVAILVVTGDPFVTAVSTAIRETNNSMLAETNNSMLVADTFTGTSAELLALVTPKGEETWRAPKGWPANHPIRHSAAPSAGAGHAPPDPPTTASTRRCRADRGLIDRRPRSS
ncbi:MAG: hypothetical protein ACR2JO_01705 [Mycobacteriales bacterium]